MKGKKLKLKRKPRAIARNEKRPSINYIPRKIRQFFSKTGLSTRLKLFLKEAVEDGKLNEAQVKKIIAKGFSVNLLREYATLLEAHHFLNRMTEKEVDEFTFKLLKKHNKI